MNSAAVNSMELDAATMPNAIASSVQTPTMTRSRVVSLMVGENDAVFIARSTSPTRV
jgi:hypothetical protein